MASMTSILFAVGRAILLAVFCGEGALVAYTIYGTWIGAPPDGRYPGLIPLDFFVAGFVAAIVVQAVNVGASQSARNRRPDR